VATKTPTKFSRVSRVVRPIFPGFFPGIDVQKGPKNKENFKASKNLFAEKEVSVVHFSKVYFLEKMSMTSKSEVRHVSP